MSQLNKTTVECQKCGAISKVETHEIRDVFDAVCPKCGSEHLYIREVHLNDVDDNGYSLVGDYKGSVDILSVQMRWLFL